jgi:poly-gamma-glutamate synthesis protein (capsule biosynthesis protein)
MSMPSLHRRAAIAALLIAGAHLAARVTGGAQEPPQRDARRELAMSVADGFTLTTVGDLIFARPVAQTPDAAFQSVVKLLQAGDVTFGNFEGTAIDIRHFQGYPAAEFGGVWIVGPPEVARDLKTMGFDMVSRANNHTTDWGLEGMRLTNEALDAAGIVHAGSGATRAAARAARYVDTPRGRVAIVSMASTFTPMSLAGDPVGEAPGRPGVSAVRVTRQVFVTADELERLRTIRAEQPAGAVTPNPNEPKDQVNLFGTVYRVGDKRGYTYTIDPTDEADILKAIRHAKMSADFVIATIHAHDPGNWSEEPADFLPVLARKAIDAGADAWIGHGPHQLRGIEIYKGKPILYSLGNFIFQLDLLQPVAQDLYERFNKNPSTMTDAEFSTFWTDRTFPGPQYYQSVVAESRFAHGQLAEIRLHPVDIGFDKRAADRGVPRLAGPQVAKDILERLQRLSQRFGTTVAIEQNVGVVRLNGQGASGAVR